MQTYIYIRTDIIYSCVYADIGIGIFQARGSGAETMESCANRNLGTSEDGSMHCIVHTVYTHVHKYFLVRLL